MRVKYFCALSKIFYVNLCSKLVYQFNKSTFSMKKTTILVLTCLLSSTLLFAQLTPAPSPGAFISQVVGVTKISIDYSRPSLKGREVFGKLIPFDKVYRTGANGSTKIETSGDIMVLRPRAGDDLSSLPQTRVVVKTGFKPDHLEQWSGHRHVCVLLPHTARSGTHRTTNRCNSK